jgi:hypothetical protein
MRTVVGLILTIVGLLSLSTLANTESQVPRIWDDAALEEWATPVAALGIRPSHYTSAEYYKTPADNLRTYPVYPPDKEPDGYWEWLQKQKPAPLVDSTAIHSTADWITAGERAFQSNDNVLARTNDPEILRAARDPATFKDVDTLPDGSILDIRWVVTDRGVQVTTSECSACHRHIRADKSVMFAGPPDGPGERTYNRPGRLIGTLRQRSGPGAIWPGTPPGEVLWRIAGTPWAPDERIDRLRSVASVTPEFLTIVNGKGGGVFLRPNGSPFYGTKIPDLHPMRYSRYLDATGTHRLRGPEDIARYGALITGADSLDFGPHHMLPEADRHVRHRFADEVLYAVAMYVMSLEPPKNPNVAPTDLLDRGNQIFRRERCGQCHTPPNYTTGGLTLAAGHRLPPNHPNRLDVMNASAETDAGLALRTRKGTGFYKIPSLRGVWYRPRLMHDGALTNLEEMFDPARQHPGYVPRGWNPAGVTERAIPGHAFGLALTVEDKQALIAFLRSL